MNGSMQISKCSVCPCAAFGESVHRAHCGLYYQLMSRSGNLKSDPMLIIDRELKDELPPPPSCPLRAGEMQLRPVPEIAVATREEFIRFVGLIPSPDNALAERLRKRRKQ